LYVTVCKHVGVGDGLIEGVGVAAGSPLMMTLSTRAMSESSPVFPQKRISILVSSAVMPRAASTYIGVGGEFVVSSARLCVLTVVQLLALDSFHCTTRSPSSLLSRSVSWPQSYSRWMFPRPVVAIPDFVAIPPLRRRRYLSPVPEVGLVAQSHPLPSLSVQPGTVFAEVVPKSSWKMMVVCVACVTPMLRSGAAINATSIKASNSGTTPRVFTIRLGLAIYYYSVRTLNWTTLLIG
jgi:hypothetical protein